MSPRRRKSGLSKDDLEALEHLPAVLKALENLAGEHAKVRALMGGEAEKSAGYWRVMRDAVGGGEDRRVMTYAPASITPEMIEASRPRPDSSATEMFWEWKDAQGRQHSVPVDGRPISNVGAAIPAKSATLDTPERREYEEAKRAGRKVPVADPFANASPAQRERMAEQRAIIDAERAARGLPARKVDAFGESIEQRRAMAEAIHDLAEADAGAVVRTETLDTVSDGTTPLASDADDDPEVH